MLMTVEALVVDSLCAHASVMRQCAIGVEITFLIQCCEVVEIAQEVVPVLVGPLGLIEHPLVRLALFVALSLPLFHWAHRFRFTLYDGLQIKHLNEIIAVLCYGGAIIGTALAGYILWNIP